MNQTNQIREEAKWAQLMMDAAAGKVYGSGCSRETPPHLPKRGDKTLGLGVGRSLKPRSVQLGLELALHFVIQFLSRRISRWLVGRNLRIFYRLNLPDAQVTRKVGGSRCCVTSCRLCGLDWRRCQPAFPTEGKAPKSWAVSASWKQ